MAATGTPTTNLGLRRPQGTDPASVDDINYNSEVIDTKLGAVGSTSVQEQINTLNSKLTTINFQHTFSNIAAGAGALETVSIPNPPSGKTLQLATVTQASGLNLVPVWLSGISRGNNTVNVQVYNARTSATDITVEIFALYW